MIGHRFTLDPNLVADAVREGRVIDVQVFSTAPGRWFTKAALGAASPHAHPVAVAKRA